MTATLAPPPPKQRERPTDGPPRDRQPMMHRAHHACTPHKALCGAPLPDGKKYPPGTKVDCVVCEAMKGGHCPYCGAKFGA